MGGYNLSNEVLSKLLDVKNQGGFRYLGSKEEPKLVVLYSTGKDVYWKDELDSTKGFYVYYGDNKTPGNEMHQTKLFGNEILRNIFNFAVSDNIEIRKKIPPILVFKSENSGSRVKFIGLAVPGIKGKPTKDWLTAVWGQTRNGERFQNYKAYFTILDTSNGSEAYAQDAKINLQWLTDIKKGNSINSMFAPKSWKNYILNKRFNPLLTTVEKFVKSKEEQLPNTEEKIQLLKYLQKYFIDKDRGYSFEKFAKYIVEALDDSVENIEATRSYKDGGIDGVEKYRIFQNSVNNIFVEFYMQAKCYNFETTSVTVKDTARLISRIKNRQFGIMVTTSYVSSQAYEELLQDGQPIVIISGKNIIDYIFDEEETRNINQLKEWLKINLNNWESRHDG